MNCCDHDCHQGKDCPIRASYSHRKVRAGQPPQDPIQFADEQLAQWEKEEANRKADAREEWFTVACTVALVIVAVLWLFGLIGIAA